MAFEIGHTPAHTGKTVVEEPIRKLDDIRRIKASLLRSPRDYAIFTLGINTAFRCGDLVSITVGDVRGKKAGDDIVIREEKTGKLRRTTLNAESVSAIAALLPPCRVVQDHDFLFQGQRGKLSVSYVNRLVKRWCSDAGLNGQYGSHSLRKTFAHAHYAHFKTSIEILMLMLNHSSPRQTLAYIGVQSDDLKNAYANAL